MKLWIALLLTLATCSTAEARWWQRGRFSHRTTYRSHTTESYHFTGSAQAVCEQKAALQARLCRMFHPGGSFGGGSCEGVACSSDAQTALNNCCYSRSGRPILGQAVVRGANGMYYACRIFR